MSDKSVGFQEVGLFAGRHKILHFAETDGGQKRHFLDAHDKDLFRPNFANELYDINVRK